MSDSPRDTAAFEVRDALRETGCPVCRLTMRSVAKLLQSIAYEQVNDVGLRNELRIAGGFCNAHAHQWLREAQHALGTALIYRDVIMAALRTLDRAPRPRRRLRGLLGGSDRRGPEGACHACHMKLEAEGRYVEALLAVVAADASALNGSDALCRRHVRTVARLGGPGADCILQQTRSSVEALLRDLEEVIRKEDYRFRHEPRSERERSAPARAIAWAAGVEGLVDT